MQQVRIVGHAFAVQLKVWSFGASACRWITFQGILILLGGRYFVGRVNLFGLPFSFISFNSLSWVYRHALCNSMVLRALSLYGSVVGVKRAFLKDISHVLLFIDSCASSHPPCSQAPRPLLCLASICACFSLQCVYGAPRGPDHRITQCKSLYHSQLRLFRKIHYLEITAWTSERRQFRMDVPYIGLRYLSRQSS